MINDVNLFKNLLIRAEKLLVPMGIWPTEKNYWMTAFNIFVLFAYSILVMVKNLLNPERETIENAFTLANGGLITVVYFVTLLMKRKKCQEFFAYVKSERKALKTQDEKDLMITVGNEFQRITKAFSYILPTSVLVRFVQPIAEFAFIQIFSDDKNFNLPPSMGIPTFIIGEIATYIVESFVRMLMLSTLMGVCTIFILSTLFICAQFYILAVDLVNIENDTDELIDGLIEKHQEILAMAKLLNEIFSPYFFADCFFSFINLSIMMFSLLASNSHIQNYLMEVPLVTAGMSQLFFVLYFGDRLLDATSQISLAAYKSKWFEKSVKNQKKIMLIIMRGQKPVTLNVGNDFMTASMYLFSQICQRAWSAFTILRTTVK